MKLFGIKKSYGQTSVLCGVDYEFKTGEHYVIKGPSGSGKSTLLHLIAGLDRADSGQMLWNNEDLSSFDDEKLARYRNQDVGLVFQHHFLLPNMTGMQNILLPQKLSKNRKIKIDIKKLAVHLGVEHCLKKIPAQMSGGEQQRINLLRAISLSPPLILADEPTGNLDSVNSDKVATLLTELAEQLGSTLIVVTHDDHIAERFRNKINIEDGHIIR